MGYSKYFDYELAEKKWINFWEEHQLYISSLDNRPAFTILMPPPNITGILHMGHILNLTVQDILIRKTRLEGKNVCWVPGTDHASIATESKVVAKLREEGLTKSAIGRERFLQEAFAWKEKYGSIIYSQFKELAISCDWSKKKFTMDKDMSRQVTQTFIKLYQECLVYRGWRIVNWDSKAKTVLSNEEVIRKDKQSTLYYIKYKLKAVEDYLVVATTRPETIMGDTAICIHPNDERYKHLIGKKAEVPLINREIPIIADTYIDREFGTGVLKVTPAHDFNDYEIGKKHGLESIDIFDDEGRVNKQAQIFVGEDRFSARKKVVAELEKIGCLVKTEIIANSIGYSERNPEIVVEPKLSLQWYLKMEDMAKTSLSHVMEDDVEFYPKKIKNTYRHWIENIRDWPISRQLWWGHRIPVYYYDSSKEKYVVAFNLEEALEKIKEKTGNQSFPLEDIIQEEDVLDTWFSSWLWPISVFDGFEAGKDFEYYYPTSVLVTGWDIIFFWVARMIMAGYHFTGKPPFKVVYFTGMVRDKQGRKMSKSLGNSPDTGKLIKEYGVDGVRFGVLASSPVGSDILFDEKLCFQGKNFINKIFNAFKLLKSWEVKKESLSDLEKITHQWFEFNLLEHTRQLDELFKSFRLSEALIIIYKLFKDDFCSWYLELIKPDSKKQISEESYNKSLDFFEQLLTLLHPFMPIITEDLWHKLRDKEPSKESSISICRFSTSESVDSYASNQVIEEFKRVQDITTKIRLFKNRYGIKQNAFLDLEVLEKKHISKTYFSLLKKLNNLKKISIVKRSNQFKYVIISGSFEYFLVWEDQTTQKIVGEKEELQKQKEYYEGFLKKVKAKLNNKNFISNAPKKVVENENKKKTDAEEKLKLLNHQLKN